MISDKKVLFGLLFTAVSTVSANSGVFYYNASGSDWTGICASVSYDFQGL